MAERKSYRFGPFLVDRRSACLRRDGVVVPLRPKTFDVLTYLTQHPGRLVPRTELIDNVWQNLNVTPNSLAQCIREILGTRCTTTPRPSSKPSPSAAICSPCR